MITESLQIVRHMIPGEFLPAYSTDELLRGVCHIAIVPPQPKTVEIKPKPVRRKKAPYQSWTRRAIASGYLATIRQMLIEGDSCRKIAKYLNVDPRTVQALVHAEPELDAILRSRDSWVRFEANRVAIYEALKTMSFSATHKKFGFDSRGLKRHLEKDKKNAKG